MLLLQLSSQTANSSQPAATLPVFQAPASAVWINSLWFLSLILSLASALFGMIAKQWLREYMEWTTTSWLPQNFLALRQTRFEAFNEWKVPAIIAAIPGLLEIALILFFSGLIVFLWTINFIVAGVSITVIAISITLAVLATILPVFYRQCPYKSPTGWACLRVVWLLAVAWERLIKKAWRRIRWDSRCGRFIQHLQIRFHTCISWRERDSGSDSKILVELGRVEVCFAVAGHRMPLKCNDGGLRAVEALVNLTALRRAFLWIQETSQNEYLLQAVEQCAAMRVTDRCPPLTLLIFDFSVACQALNADPKWLCQKLDEGYDIILVGDQVEYASLRYQDRLSIGHDDERGALALKRARPQLLRQLAQTLAYDLSLLFDHIDVKQAYHNEVSARFLMRIISLCVYLTYEVNSDQRAFLNCLAPHFHRFCEMDCALPGLAITLFVLLCGYPESIVERRECPISFPWSVSDPHVQRSISGVQNSH